MADGLPRGAGTRGSSLRGPAAGRGPSLRVAGCRRRAPSDVGNGRRHARAAAPENGVEASSLPAEVDVEAQVEEFMKKQAELESGEAFNRIVPPDTIVGADVVSDELAQQFVSDVQTALKVLNTTRDMGLNEVKLTITIEGPRERELRRLGLEKDTGASRDEMAAVLEEVSRGRVPNDRIALKALAEEMNDWTASLAQLADSVGASGIEPTSGWREGQARPPIGRDKNEEPQGLADMLPEWMGYSTLYLLSAVPLFIGATIVVILFVNSLK